MNIVVYGTLRKGMPNFKHFGSGLEHLETIELQGYKLYAWKTLPFVVQTGIKSDTVKCDLLFVDSPLYSRNIDKMELSYDYFIDTIMWDNNPYKIYLYTNVKEEAKEVPSGDWKEYAKKNNFYKNM